MAEKSFGVKEINLIGASGTPTIESPNNLNLNAVNVAISTNATIGGNLTVSGTVGIAGTLTYEDVTNVDAVGIITARDGVFIPDNKELKIGNTAGSPDFSIKHDTSNTILDGNTGDIIIRADGDDLKLLAEDDIVLRDNDDSTNFIHCINGGAVELYHNGTKRLETTSSGASVTGTVAATTFSGSGASLTNLPAANLTGTLPAISGANLTGIAVTEAPVTDYTITGDGGDYYFHGGGVDETEGDPDLYLIRGQKYRFNNTTGSNHPFKFRVSSGGSAYTDGISGDDEGVQFFTVPYAAPASIVYQCSIHSGMVGNIYIRGANGQNDNVGVTTFSGAVSGSTATFSGNLSANGLTATSFVSVGDNDIINVGSGNDLKIYHQSSDNNSYIENDTGNLIIRADAANKDITLQAADVLIFNTGGANERLRITSGGTVNIGANLSQTTYPFSVQGSSNTTAIIKCSGNDTANLYLDANRNGAGANISLISGLWNGTRVAEMRFLTGSDTSNKDDGQISLRTASAGTPEERIRITSDGKIGINNSSPSTEIELSFNSGSTAPTSGTTPKGIALSFGNSNGHNAGIWFSGDVGGDQGISGICGTRTSGYNTDLRFYTNSTGSARAFTERLRILANGGVGINTSNFSSSLNNEVGLAIHGQSNDNCRIVLSTPTKSNPPSLIGYYGLNRLGIDCHDGVEIRDVTASYATRFKIDQNGQVTKPYTYKFLVETNGTSVSGGWTKLTGLSIDSNYSTGVSNGTNWSNSNQRFTAPVSGTYLFFIGGFSSTAHGGGTNHRYMYVFQVNGSGLKYGFGGNYSDNNTPMAGGAMHIPLNANDYVEVQYFTAISATWGAGHRFFWGGYLLG